MCFYGSRGIFCLKKIRSLTLRSIRVWLFFSHNLPFMRLVVALKAPPIGLLIQELGVLDTFFSLKQNLELAIPYFRFLKR